jgi:Carboxypeptidase regulatory-like domain
VPVVVRMRYLVCADSPEPADAVALLDKVLAAVLDHPVLDGGDRLEVDLTPLSAETWMALGAHPRAAFCVRLDAAHEFAPGEVAYVRQPLQLAGSTLRALRGRVVGPDDIPLAGAVVTLAATGAHDRTSPDGTFLFPTVPTGSGPIRLAVRAKGRVFTAEVEPDGDEPLVVHCDPLEG